MTGPTPGTEHKRSTVSSLFVSPTSSLSAIDYVKGKAAEVLSDSFPHALSQYDSRLDRVIATGRYEELRQCGARP